MNNTYRLSEAIEAGAQKRAQSFGMYFQERSGQLCSCALGAAYEAVTGNTKMQMGLLAQRFPILNRIVPSALVPAGLNLSAPTTLYDVVVKLSDEKFERREEIAEYVRQFEQLEGVH